MFVNMKMRNDCRVLLSLEYKMSPRIIIKKLLFFQKCSGRILESTFLISKERKKSTITPQFSGYHCIKNTTDLKCESCVKLFVNGICKIKLQTGYTEYTTELHYLPLKFIRFG